MPGSSFLLTLKCKAGEQEWILAIARMTVGVGLLGLFLVIPANAGIQLFAHSEAQSRQTGMDSGLRQNDGGMG